MISAHDILVERDCRVAGCAVGAEHGSFCRHHTAELRARLRVGTTHGKRRGGFIRQGSFHPTSRR